MKLVLSTLLLVFLTFTTAFAEPTDSLYAEPADSSALGWEEIESSLNYRQGTIELPDGNAALIVPAGFAYLGPEDADYVLADLWGNPHDETILGLLVMKDRGVTDAGSWVFALSYEEIGYVDDADAEDINYDDLRIEMQEDSRVWNKERAEMGYEPVYFVGWAEAPHYDKNRKVLHWAKELKFGEHSLHTLNYNLRVLGRKGVFVLNAVASMDELEEVHANIDLALNSVIFQKGSAYADFNPDLDKVAAYTVGGLVAGKVLAKAGFFALILKFWKVIAAGVAGIGGFLFNRSKKKKEAASETTAEGGDNS